MRDRIFPIFGQFNVLAGKIIPEESRSGDSTTVCINVDIIKKEISEMQKTITKYEKDPNIKNDAIYSHIIKHIHRFELYKELLKQEKNKYDIKNLTRELDLYKEAINIELEYIRGE